MFTKICKDEMYNYYANMDVLDFKYSKFGKLSDLPPRIVEEIVKYENSVSMAEFTKKEYGDILENMKLIYTNYEEQAENIALIDEVRNKIIHQYINIDGIERLFSDKYLDFEWDMHMGMDFENHSMKFYRDHYIHQIRDAYTMHMFIEKSGLYNKIRDLLFDPGASKISDYTVRLIDRQLADYRNSVTAEAARKCIRRENPSLVSKCPAFKKKVEELQREHYMRNIIYMSSYIAGLFHDIGYPAIHYMNTQRRIKNYISIIYNILDSGSNFDRINSVLQNSLLFKIVAQGEVQKRIFDDYDHGAMSAVIFLMAFYENGAIEKLPPYKVAAVELAAVAIYNHTNEYVSMDDDKRGKTSYYKATFALNPIAYVLRVCDDLQEWSRTYFELSEKSNMVICPKCHMLVKRKKGGYEEPISYMCRCVGKEDGLFKSMYTNKNNFVHRRMVNIDVCDRIEIESDDDNSHMIVGVRYSLYKLLHIAYISQTYAKQRAKELNKLKLFLKKQFDFPFVYLNYDMSANVILVKSLILGEYLAKHAKEDYDDFCAQTDKIIDEGDISVSDLMKEADSFVNKSFSKIERIYRNFEKGLKEYIDRCVRLYLYLYSFRMMCSHLNECGRNAVVIKSLESQIKDRINYNMITDKDLKVLTDNCLYEFSIQFLSERYPLIFEEYYKTYKVNDGLLNTEKRFNDLEEYKIPDFAHISDSYIDAFSDLGLFYELQIEAERKPKEGYCVIVHF